MLLLCKDDYREMLKNGDHCEAQIPGINYPSLQSRDGTFCEEKFLLKGKAVFLLAIVI